MASDEEDDDDNADKKEDDDMEGEVMPNIVHFDIWTKVKFV